MLNLKVKVITKAKNLILVLLIIQIISCTGKPKEKHSTDITIKNEINTQPFILNYSTTFPQIHTNLNGMVREFVRTMHQDKKGNFWFGTNGDGIIRYDGKVLEKLIIPRISSGARVLDIIEDKKGNVWFGTSDGLIKYDGKAFKIFSKKDGLPGENEEIWSLTIDRSGKFWIGSIGGLSHFDGKKFIPFSLPESMVQNPKHMLSNTLIKKVIEDKKGIIWVVTDGNGIFKYNMGEFTHLTTKNGLTDNNAADIFEDSRGNIWIGTYYGGVSKFSGKTYTNFTKEGIIEGEETYNFYEDSQGNVWFTAEGFGVYRYDGIAFKQYTTEDGLTSNVTQSIYEDNKGQIWFGSWQGLSIFDGEKFMNAKLKESWTK
jgi:ligand-binding sensor domain-containing protein